MWTYLEDHVSRWLDRIFQAFSIFYVAIKKDMENRLPLTAFSDKAEDLLTYEQCVLCWPRSRHSNAIMTSLPIFPCICISRHWEFFQHFFHQYLHQYSWSLNKIYENVCEFFWDEVLTVRNTGKTRQSWCLAVIFGKKKSFWQFPRKVDPTFLKTCVQDHVDSFSQLPKKKDWLALLGIFSTICSSNPFPNVREVWAKSMLTFVSYFQWDDVFIARNS